MDNVLWFLLLACLAIAGITVLMGVDFYRFLRDERKKEEEKANGS